MLDQFFFFFTWQSALNLHSRSNHVGDWICDIIFQPCFGISRDMYIYSHLSIILPGMKYLYVFLKLIIVLSLPCEDWLP